MSHKAKRQLLRKLNAHVIGQMTLGSGFNDGSPPIAGSKNPIQFLRAGGDCDGLLRCICDTHIEASVVIRNNITTTQSLTY